MMKLTLVLMFCAVISIAAEVPPRALSSSATHLTKGGDGPQPLPIGKTLPLFFGPGDGPMPIKPIVLVPPGVRSGSHCAYPTR